MEIGFKDMKSRVWLEITGWEDYGVVPVDVEVLDCEGLGHLESFVTVSSRFRGSCYFTVGGAEQVAASYRGYRFVVVVDEKNRVDRTYCSMRKLEKV